MPPGTLLLLALVAVAIAGCRASPADRAREAEQTRRSWEATLQLLTQERARGAVPEVFARQVRRAADESRRKAASP